MKSAIRSSGWNEIDAFINRLLQRTIIRNSRPVNRTLKVMGVYEMLYDKGVKRDIGNWHEMAWLETSDRLR